MYRQCFPPISHTQVCRGRYCPQLTLPSSTRVRRVRVSATYHITPVHRLLRLLRRITPIPAIRVRLWGPQPSWPIQRIPVMPTLWSTTLSHSLSLRAFRFTLLRPNRVCGKTIPSSRLARIWRSSFLRVFLSLINSTGLFPQLKLGLLTAPLNALLRVQAVLAV